MAYACNIQLTGSLEKTNTPPYSSRLQYSPSLMFVASNVWHLIRGSHILD